MTAPKQLFLIAMLFAAGSPAEASAPDCHREMYLGFDSRLGLELAGRLPPGGEVVRGFELVGGSPVVAFDHRLLVFGPEQDAGIPVLDRVEGVAVSDERGLRVMTSKGHLQLGAMGLQKDPESHRLGGGRLFNSGTSVYLSVTEEANGTLVELRHPLGPAFPLAGFEGELRTASWNRTGMALVVGNHLYTWEDGADELLRLLIDEGLSSARDVVLVGPDRAVVALDDSVVLITRETVLVLVGFPARVRYQDDRLYLLDLRTGFIWRAVGLESLGDVEADRARGRALLRESAASPGDRASANAFLEASRILGCKAALTEVASETQTDNPTSSLR